MDTINFIYSLIGTPLGYILYFIYEIGITNVGLAIILFTFIVKLAMLPLSIKQQKNTAKSAIFAPKVQEIQQKYRNNQQKQQEELAKLQQQGYNPMGGCGTLMLTFLLLFGVLDVVYKPMTHIIHTSETEVVAMMEEGYSVKLTSIIVDEYNNTAADLKGDALVKHEELVRDAGKLLDYYNANRADGASAYDESVWETVSADSIRVVEGAIKAALKNEYEVVKANNDGNGKEVLFTATDLFSITDYDRKDAAGNTISSEKVELNSSENDEAKAAYKAAHAFGDKTKDQFNTLQNQYGYWKIDASGDVKFVPNTSLQRELYTLETFGTVKEYADGTTIEYKQFFNSVGNVEEISELYENLNFIGIKLGQVPIEHMGFPMVLVPIIAFILSLIQTFISNKQMETNNPGSVGGGMKLTMYIMPIFSIIFVFTVPAGAGFYWTISYVFGIAQSLILNKLYNPQKLKAQAQAEYNERMKRIETQARQARNSDSEMVEYNGEKLSQKEINRRKLAEARRQDALKYGEEYIEDEDDK
ncbi:MAG: YidC/Oxa1 family membrane protein insertase [Oscillospiraceae bacterium]|nr:YidC/Oxa1 family membrane protein insertase [Oscillospiraceae bacterium]